eukprot:TRINITY_DN2258_c2_g1_i7.p2 TRINITY_DN2258_c2_g1~~TRINITY_DN2258_c2_g1_i7.p2  ORF type:complete len:112 (+),score=34.49 TRINITY_DN2258_c2_g1_i7:44-337(+)
MGNYVPGKYFEEQHNIEHARFELRALMQTVDGTFEKCVEPVFDQSETKELTEDERRCALEYIRTRKAFHKKFRMQFENKLKESFEAKQKAEMKGNSM